MNKTDHTLDLSMAAAEKDGLPYLGDAEVVRDLVGNLGSDALLRLVEVSNGTMTGEQAAEKDAEEARALAQVFLGQDPDYNGLQHWNEPGKIDAFVAAEADIAEQEPEARIATLLLLMIQDMYAAAQMMDAGEAEADAKAAIDGSIEGTTALLMGIPFQEYEADGLDTTDGVDDEATP